MLNFWIIFFTALAGLALGVFGTLIYFCLTLEQSTGEEREWLDED